MIWNELNESVTYALTAGACGKGSESIDWLGGDSPCKLSIIIEWSNPSGSWTSCTLPGFDAR